MVQEVIDDRLQIIESEEYNNKEGEGFSHTVLVMRAMNNCLKSGIKEMRAGYFNEKVDTHGNSIKVYIEDTRKAFIESVRTCIMIMGCEMDEKAKENIKKIEDELEKKYQKLCKDEFEEWNSINIKEKHIRWNEGMYYKQDYLNIRLYFYQEYIEEQVKSYRKICEELNNLTKRLNFYEGFDIEA